jgi:Cu-processing system permease protein
MTRVIRYIFNDILRTRFILFYTGFLLLSTFALFQLDSDFGKIVLSLLNIVLMVVPLVSVVFTTIHFFSSYEFIELMLAQPINRKVSLLVTGVFLTLVFVSLAFLSSVLTRDKSKAIGIALLFWFYFSLIYDGFVLWIIYSFNDYPLEKVTLTLIAFNPVDLARIIMLLQLDISALMGYTGAFYKNFFGSNMGVLFSSSILFLWAIIPIYIALRIFNKKDL